LALGEAQLALAAALDAHPLKSSFAAMRAYKQQALGMVHQIELVRRALFATSSMMQLTILRMI